MRTTLYNVIVYPVLGGLWVGCFSLRAPFREQMQGGISDSVRRLAAQRMGS